MRLVLQQSVVCRNMIIVMMCECVFAIEEWVQQQAVDSSSPAGRHREWKCLPRICEFATLKACRERRFKSHVHEVTTGLLTFIMPNKRKRLTPGGRANGEANQSQEMGNMRQAL